MKLRILGDSVRLRLTVPEVARIGRGEAVEQSTAFTSGATFVYRLVPCPSTESASADFESGAIVVRVSTALAKRWAEDDRQVSIEGASAVPRVLVEKDFACLDPSPDEDQSDMFSNPKTC